LAIGAAFPATCAWAIVLELAGILDVLPAVPELLLEELIAPAALLLAPLFGAELATSAEPAAVERELVAGVSDELACAGVISCCDASVSRPSPHAPNQRDAATAPTGTMITPLSDSRREIRFSRGTSLFMLSSYGSICANRHA
jgi:hypothetical protein